jgi:hypothetical protein
MADKVKNPLGETCASIRGVGGLHAAKTESTQNVAYVPRRSPDPRFRGIPSAIREF